LFCADAARQPRRAGRQLSAAAGGSRLVGSAFTIAVPENNTQPLESFAAQYGQGLSNMLEANPGVDVYLPHSGSTLIIPQQLILPDTVREGIVINVAEMRLYYYPPLGNSVEVLPIGIGRPDAKRRVTG
jgi:L,D-transpeptidase ErfK/SrfK